MGPSDEQHIFHSVNPHTKLSLLGKSGVNGFGRPLAKISERHSVLAPDLDWNGYYRALFPSARNTTSAGLSGLRPKGIWVTFHWTASLDYAVVNSSVQAQSRTQVFGTKRVRHNVFFLWYSRTP